MTLSVLYNDNHMLVAIKPAGMPTQPDFEEWCRSWLKEALNKPGNAFLHVIHRLDTPVSGMVVCACTSKALSRLQAAVREGKLYKRYIALVAGQPPANSGTLEHYLFHDMQQRCARVVSASAPHARRAELSYKVLGQQGAYYWLEVILVTGRYHQIRAQLAAIGCPILGDTKYGCRVPFHPGAIALHHSTVSVPHPTQNVMLTFEAPLPPYWPALSPVL
jgi:23S rRNA pseudouridine1911/1915/1917 synthase